VGIVATRVTFVSPVTGGGFLLGLLLGIIGGIVAIFFEADTDTAVDLGDL
jgi:capsular polysaccharide biosynthesis protein